MESPSIEGLFLYEGVFIETKKEQAILIRKSPGIKKLMLVLNS